MSNELKRGVPPARPTATDLPLTEKTGCPAALESLAYRQREDDRGYEATETISNHFFSSSSYLIRRSDGFSILTLLSVGGKVRLNNFSCFCVILVRFHEICGTLVGFRRLTWYRLLRDLLVLRGFLCGFL